MSGDSITNALLLIMVIIVALLAGVTAGVQYQKTQPVQMTITWINSQNGTHMDCIYPMPSGHWFGIQINRAAQWNVGAIALKTG